MNYSGLTFIIVNIFFNESDHFIRNRFLRRRNLNQGIKVSLIYPSKIFIMKLGEELILEIDPVVV